MRLLILVVAGILLPAGSLAAPATTDNEVSRPTVGLVLSGGGARGAAHIGVLRYLEENRIPVDFIAGTSVGAIIGGLYAGGMSAAEIEALVTSLDWREMFSDGALPGELGIRRKLQRYRYLVDFDAGIQDGELVFSTGFIQGQRMMLMLRENTLPVRHITDFDELPTPFRAVATNLETARAVVFDEGDLVHAIRASMSVPGVYSPVEHDGAWLVDGGLVQNLPVPVALEANMDTLIAMDVATPLRAFNELDSPFAVTSQVIDGVMLNQSREMRQLLRPNDILIAPEMKEFGAATFDGIPDIIARGYAHAAARSDVLLKLSVSEAAYAAWQSAREARRMALPLIARVEVDSDERADALVRSRLAQQVGATLDVEQLNEGLASIYGLGLFETVGYEIRDADEDGETLLVRTQSKGTGPLRFETGFELQETFSGSTAFQLRAALNQSGINPLGAEWRTEIGLGTVTGISTEFHQPLVYSGRLFTAANYTYAIGDLVIQDDSGTLGEFRLRENVIGFDIGTNLGAASTMRLGIRRGEEDILLQQDETASFDDPGFDVGDVVFQYNHDSMDSFTFPSQGLRVDLRFEAAQDELGAAEDGEYAGLDVLAAFGDGYDNVLIGGTFESVLSGERFLSQGVALGGVTRLSGFERDELVGKHAGLLRGVYYRYLGRNPDRFIDTPLYAGMTLEAGNVWQDSDDVSGDDVIYGASVFVALDTFLGPVSLAYGGNSDGRDAFYLSIGTINGPSFRQFRR